MPLAADSASGTIDCVFFMDLPVEGEPLELLEYFKGGFAVHWAGPGATREAGRFCLVAGSPPRRRVVGSPVLAGIPASGTTAGEDLAYGGLVRRRRGTLGPGGAAGISELRSSGLSTARTLTTSRHRNPSARSAPPALSGFDFAFLGVSASRR